MHCSDLLRARFAAGWVICMKKYDLIVVGGGISGVAAAVSAARDGLSVLLIEKYGCLGGAMSMSLVYPFMKYFMKDENGGNRLLSDGIFTEMRKRWAACGDSSFETFKLVFDDMISEAGADVLFHTNVYKAECSDRRIKKLYAASKSGVLELEADFFIDASGDGELIAMTGCEFQLGRESDGFCQPMTTCFRLSGVDEKRFFEDMKMMQEKYKEYKAEGRLHNPRENLLVFTGLGDGVIHFNTTRVIRHNPVDPVEISNAEILARRQVAEMVKFFKEVSPSCANASLVSVATHIGVRESRKLKGVHILTADEIKNCVDFEDTIALGNYEIDIHNPTGTGTELYYFKDNEYYRIPYRSLLPKEYDNMLVAGRCLSATHEAHSAVRILPICACLGEAAGTAAALAKTTVGKVQDIDVQQLRQNLRDKGAAL